jgi:Cell division septal protein
LQIFFNKNIFFIEKNKIITVLNKFNFLKDFNIQKVFPSKLVITAKKTKFLGSTFINGKKFYIGDNEKFTLANEIEKEKNLPIAFGKFSIKEFLELQNVLLEEKIDLNKVEKYFYHMSRRWDLQKNNGLIIMLPSKNISYSLELYNKLKNNNKINSAKIVDLRIPERVVINYE